MADIVVKNGYNGFNNTKKHNNNNQRKQSSFSNKLPPLGTQRNDFISSEGTSISPILQPSVSDHGTTTTTDIVILLDDEVRRIHRLSINLGIKHHYEIAEYHNRFHGRKPGRLPKLKTSKCWRQSHNWIKRTDSEMGFDLRRNAVTLGKQFDNSSVDLNSLPRGRRKVLEPVDIPALGCSYRLPVLKKHKPNTGR